MATATAPAVRPRSQAKLVFFLVFFATTIFAAYEKNARILDPTSPIAQHFAPAKGDLAVHRFFGISAMAVAAFQFSNRLWARYLRLHRVFGYVYVTSVFISAPLAVLVAMKIPKSFSLVAANCMQSFGWLVTTSIALYCVRSGNIALHRRWMIRSYPFAMVFTAARTLHLILPAARLGPTGGEATLWFCFALAAFLPSVFLDWPTISQRNAMRAVNAARPAILGRDWPKQTTLLRTGLSEKAGDTRPAQDKMRK